MGSIFSTTEDKRAHRRRKTAIAELAARLVGVHQKKKTYPQDINELSHEEKMEELKNTFDIFDRDGSGEISINEVRCTLNAFGFFPSEAFLQECLRKFDLDNNRLIDFDEFKFMYATLMKDSSKLATEELREVFNTLEVIDKRKCNTKRYHGMGCDEDGFITDKENPLYFSNYHPTGSVAVQDVVRMLTMTQANMGGSDECSAISEEEAKAFSLQFTDESGRVQTSDIVAFLTASE